MVVPTARSICDLLGFLKEATDITETKQSVNNEPNQKDAHMVWDDFWEDVLDRSDGMPIAKTDDGPGIWAVPDRGSNSWCFSTNWRENAKKKKKFEEAGYAMRLNQRALTQSKVKA